MKSERKLSKVLFVLYLVLQVGIGIFLSNMFILPRLAQGWTTAQSAQAICILDTSAGKNNANVKVAFTNNQIGTPGPNTVNGKSMDVVAKDNWSGKEVNLGSIAVGETKEGFINTEQASITTGSTVTFTMTWSDGSFAGEDILGIDHRTESYSALECPQSVSPTATPTPTPIAVAATPTPTPVPSAPTPTPTPIVVVQGVSVGPTPTPTPAPPQVQVLAAATVRQLPKTGAADGILFGLLSLLPVGFILRNKAKNMFS